MTSMNRITLCTSIVLATMLSGVSPAAAAAGDLFSFETVDAVEVDDYLHITITGVLAGDTEASTYTFTASANSDRAAAAVANARCERLALLAMSKPGKYVFSALQVSNGSTPKFTCKLAVNLD
jgi:hypothetical protein